MAARLWTASEELTGVRFDQLDEVVARIRALPCAW